MKITFEKVTLKKLHNELIIAQKINNLHLYKMVSCLLMIHKNKKIDEVANYFNLSCKTVYNWISQFLVKGFSWLIMHHYKGRGKKSRLSKDQKQKLYEIVKKGPESYGFNCGVWNSVLILEVIQKEFKVTYNPRYLCEILKSIGLSFQKAKFISALQDDEEHQKKKNGKLLLFLKY